MTLDQIQAQLSGVTYEDAIWYYKMQKDNFIQEYKKALGTESEQQASMYVNDFIKEINSGKFQQQSFGAINTYLSELEKSLTAYFTGQGKNLLDSLEFDQNKKYSEQKTSAINKVTEIIEKFSQLNEMHEVLEKALMKFCLQNNNNMDLSDLLNFGRAYARQYLFSLKTNNAVSINKAIGAGYFEEALVHKATGSLTKYLKNHIGGSMMTGSAKINGVDTVFDEYINFFSQDLSTSFQESVVFEDRQLLSGFGAQIKLWNPPWNVARPRASYHITHNKTLFEAWPEKKSWIQGVLFLQNKVREAIGDNVFYVTGNNFYWTFELISEFRAQQYWLAFHNSNNKFTSQVSWETINLAKPDKNIP